MWEQRLSTAHGGFSVRSIFTYALAVLIAAFLWIIASPQPTFAADASWSGASITYDGNIYTGPASEQTVAALKLPKNTTVYTYVEPTGTTNRKIHILYFAPGVDPGTADGANYRTHAYTGPNSFGSGSVAVAVNLEPQTDNDGTSSCVVEGGLGWIICPITNTLASWMDWVFNILASFLTVRPVETGQENAMYRAWAFMRTIANLAFVIAFLIIIYSQLTNYGVSNYGIKKLLPRIIIAAILVNISYIICSLAIDLSNFFGHSIQNIFIQMRNSLVGTEGNTWDLLSWESLSSFVLSGGTAVIAGSIAAFSGIATYGIIGALALLLPALVSLLVAVLVALIVMAARQALITILTILAPLAFVAYLLPNTEKWFDKWRSTFMTMLILFPAFSVIFGGSQLAGILIIQNADSINLVILGMIVQVAPLFVTPFLIKFSGSLLGRIAGMVNNPNKGIIDRTRNFAKDRAENIKARRLGTEARPGVFGAAQRASQRIDHNRRRREGWRNAHTAMADANWASSRDFSDIDQRSREAGDRKTVGENNSALRYERSKITNASLRQLDVDVRQVKLNLENAQVSSEIENWERNHAAPIVTSKLQQRVLKDTQAALHSTHDAEYEEFKQGNLAHHIPRSANVNAMLNETSDNTRRLALNAMRNESAKRAVNEQFAQELESNTLRVDGQLMQAYAGGIQGAVGAQRALASALSTQQSAHSESIKNAQSILSHSNYTDQQVTDIALGNSGTTGINVTDDLREAAIMKVAGSGNTDEIIRLMRDIDINTSPLTQDFRQAFFDTLMSNNNRPKWATFGAMAELKQGNAPAAGQGRIDEWIINTFNADKFSSADLLVTHDKSYLSELADVMSRRPSAFNRGAIDKFREQYRIATSNEDYTGKIGDRDGALQAIGTELRRMP